MKWEAEKQTLLPPPSIFPSSLNACWVPTVCERPQPKGKEYRMNTFCLPGVGAPLCELKAVDDQCQVAGLWG